MGGSCVLWLYGVGREHSVLLGSAVKGGGVEMREEGGREEVSVFEVSGVRGVAVQCIDDTKRCDCGGGFLGRN